MQNKNRVYSTETGKICPACDSPLATCKCAQRAAGTLANSTGDGVVRIMRETKGRKGAGVTVVRGLMVEQAELKAIAKKLKQLCSCGGAIKDGTIEIQGDHREKIKAHLISAGHTVKIAGG